MIADHSLDLTLERARRDSVEFPYLLANHVPMVLIALDRLGASPARIDAWYETYRRAHGLQPPPPPVAPIDAAGWKDALGDRRREADYRSFFCREVKTLGPDEAIRRYIPELVGGIGASALHPLMRLAYGLIARDDAEIGTALGYWAACHLPLPSGCAAQGDLDDPAALLAGVSGIEGICSYRPETDLLWHNIRAVGALPGFAALAGRLKVTCDSPRRMAATALAVFAATMDFSALHAVTGLHWVRVVAPHLDDPLPLYRALWQVVATLVPKIGFPSLPCAEALEAMRRQPAPSWEAIKAAAIASDDEHDVSLVFSASEEEKLWGDPLYRVVAARRVGLLP